MSLAVWLGAVRKCSAASEEVFCGKEVFRPVMSINHPAPTSWCKNRIDRILLAQLLSNLQPFTKVPKSGTLSQYQFTSSSSFFA